MNNIIKRKIDKIPRDLEYHPTLGALYGGAGFVVLGAQWAGFNLAWQIEPRPYFNITTFRHNFPTTPYSTEESAFFGTTPDVIWGSPSCGEFSSAGRNSSNAKNMQLKSFKDFEYVKFVLQIKARRPLIFILENIPSVKSFVDFVSTPAGFALRHTISGEEVELYDYYIEEHQLTPTQLMFPQNRKRIFTIGTRLPGRFMLIPPMNDYRDSLSIESIFKDLDKLRKEETLLNDTFPTHTPEKLEKIGRVKQGEQLYGGINNKRLDPSKPSPVIMSSSTRYIHPWEDRLLTVRENACLMGVPLDFVFSGSEKKALDQVGKAIVPQVGEFILKQVYEFLKKRNHI